MKHIFLVETPVGQADKNAQLYKKSILRVAEEKGIKVTQVLVENQEGMDSFSDCHTPTLILEPCEFEKPLYFNNLETYCTANVIADYCKEYFDNYARVLIINRSELIGRPLANLLLDEDFTVTIAHSKTTLAYLTELIEDAHIVIVATGKNVNYLDLHNNIVIDVGGNYQGNSRIYVGMKEIGALTTEYMLNKVKE